MLTNTQWQYYRNIINKAHESFNQDTIVWKRLITGLQRFGEDDVDNDGTTEVELKCLISYNIFRTWPMSLETVSGQIDKESMLMILNIDYLESIGYLSSDGNFNFDPGKDVFTYRGQRYRAAGETPAGQAGSKPLLYYVILSREETLTGNSKYGN